MLWHAKVLSEPLATIEQYRISLNRNTMVVNDHFIREGHASHTTMSQHIEVHEKWYPNSIEQKH